MGIAIIRNAKHTLGRLTWVYSHNERKNTNYSNKEINKEKTKDNYWLKKPENPYVKEFFLIREKYNLSGMLRKNSKAYSKLKEVFFECFVEDRLDKKKLASIIFLNKKRTQFFCVLFGA